MPAFPPVAGANGGYGIETCIVIGDNLPSSPPANGGQTFTNSHVASMAGMAPSAQAFMNLHNVPRSAQSFTNLHVLSIVAMAQMGQTFTNSQMASMAGTAPSVHSFANSHVASI